MKLHLIVAAAIMAPGIALAGAHSEIKVTAADQDVSNGVVSAEEVVAGQNGWLVIHRTEDGMKPGPVVGYAPLRAGMNQDVAAILQETVAPGEMLMLMVHVDGDATGMFEYTLGATIDGPVRVDDKLVMQVVTAQ